MGASGGKLKLGTKLWEGYRLPWLSRRSAVGQEPVYQLMKVTMEETEADIAIVNGSVVNMYTGEVK